MERFSDYKSLSLRERSVVTIGNFDGLHRGHQALLSRAREIAVAEQAALWVLSFEPHPARYFAPNAAPPRLYLPAEKASLLERYSVDGFLEQRFDATFASMSAMEFIDQVLCAALKVAGVVVGYDFAFGAGRKGGARELHAASELHSFQFAVVSAREDEQGEGVISSSRIRACLRAGEVEAAARLLSRSYHLSGTCLPGHQRGREIGFPTVNLAQEETLCPGKGVYSGWLSWGAGPRPAMINIGENPTFTGDHGLIDCQPLAIEAHALGDDEVPELYHRPCRIWFATRLRDERSFSSPEALRAQLDQDRSDALHQLAAHPTPRWPLLKA
ncbi:MAG: riboflavin biosynthesis protein RibF [Myxococcota bacterium]|nr:riboflavin biosynthesis protein RibF [Myxococcota bacterium]